MDLLDGEVHLKILNFLESINKKKRIFLHYGDLRDYQSLIPAIKKSKPDYLFHLAAQSYHSLVSSPIDTYETNILGTHNILNSEE